MSFARVFVALTVVLTAFAASAVGEETTLTVEYLWAESASGGALVASSPAHGLEASLAADGLVVTPTGGEWELRLVLARSGR